VATDVERVLGGVVPMPLGSVGDPIVFGLGGETLVPPQTSFSSNTRLAG
jgi:hypothetical protein